MTTESIVSKVWSFCHTLRDDGVGYGDHLPEPDILAEEIIENIEAGLADFRDVDAALPGR